MNRIVLLRSTSVKKNNTVLLSCMKYGSINTKLKYICSVIIITSQMDSDGYCANDIL